MLIAIQGQPSVLGSFTLGGYDSSRVNPTNVSFPLAGNDSVSLIVGIKTITASNTLAENVNLLPSGVIATIDTSLPFIWLPTSACQLFETAFGLTWDASKELYLVNDTSHQQLLVNDPSVSFTLGNLASGPSINITLPYSAFDLQASNPIYPNGTDYFPLKRAATADQYVLGRTFLQESYVFVDYEESKFSISQAEFPSNANPTLVDVNHSPVAPAAPSSQGHSGSTLSHGALAGIVIGSSVAFVILCALVVFSFRRRRQRRESQPQPATNTVRTLTSPTVKESWPSSPSNSHDPGLSPQTEMSETDRNGILGSHRTQRLANNVGELEDPMTASTTPNIHWPSPAKPRQELHGSDTAKELPPTPKEKHFAELASNDVRSSRGKS